MAFIDIYIYKNVKKLLISKKTPYLWIFANVLKHKKKKKNKLIFKKSIIKLVLKSV